MESENKLKFLKHWGLFFQFDNGNFSERLIKCFLYFREYEEVFFFFS